MKPFTAGSRVVQPTYGPGTIVEITDAHVIIDFDARGLDLLTRRIFSAKLVSLAPFVATAAAPPAPSTKKPARKSKKESA